MQRSERTRHEALPLRAATPDDVKSLQALLPAGTAMALPRVAHEHWWVTGGSDGRPVACLRLRPAIGLDQPRHWFHVGCVVHAATDLAHFRRQRTLLLGNDYTGAAELTDIACDAAALAPAARADVLRSLVRAALAQIARQRAAYAEQLIVELPGVRDVEGRSPFWDGLGRHFYDGDPQQAALRLGPAWRSHVAALLPRQPVYAAFLAPPAQAAIAEPALDARLLAQVLTECGLRYGDHIGVHDGGPVHAGCIDALPSVMDARGA